MSEPFDYDVYLSYCPEDRETAQDLDKRLRKEGLKVWLDRRRIQPALEKSRTMVMCMPRTTSVRSGAHWNTIPCCSAIPPMPSDAFCRV